ncbi:hypothetical protein [Nocardia sp. NPDC051750]|uniref:hypothetical protein n=1 Tax=Nocardia sp. NPDC051750 TaxID=3364325 RepID=UPI0037B15BCE
MVGDIEALLTAELRQLAAEFFVDQRGLVHRPQDDGMLPGKTPVGGKVEPHGLRIAEVRIVRCLPGLFVARCIEVGQQCPQ